MNNSRNILLPFLGVGTALCLGTLWLYYLSLNFPSSVENRSHLKFPTSLLELNQLVSLLNKYRTDHSDYVLLLFCSAYVYKQTFAIPGSVFLNLLAGSLFGLWVGFPLVCVLTAIGATCCFLLSRLFGRALILLYFPEKVKSLQLKVKENLDRLFFFLLFLRLFPMSPNWFLNVTSPIVNVPLHYFFLSVLIGLMPYNFICVQTGSILSELKSLDDLFSTWTLLSLTSVAMVALLSGYLMKRRRGDQTTHRGGSPPTPPPRTS